MPPCSLADRNAYRSAFEISTNHAPSYTFSLARDERVTIAFLASTSFIECLRERSAAGPGVLRRLALAFVGEKFEVLCVAQQHIRSDYVFREVVSIDRK